MRIQIIMLNHLKVKLLKIYNDGVRLYNYQNQQVVVGRVEKRENMGSKWNTIYTGNPMIDYIEEIHIIGDASDTKLESEIHWICCHFQCCKNYGLIVDIVTYNLKI